MEITYLIPHISNRTLHVGAVVAVVVAIQVVHLLIHLRVRLLALRVINSFKTILYKMSLQSI